MTTSTKTQQLIRQFFLPRLAVLCIRYDHGLGTQEYATALTCFAFELEGEWFLTTAGHILERLDKLLSLGGRILESQLFDSWTGGQAQALSVPLNYSDSNRLYIDDDGMDVGVIHLRELLRKGLQSRGIQPFVRAHWTSPPQTPDVYVVVGVPSEFIKERTSSQGTIEGLSIEPVIVFLDPCDEPPEMKKRFRRLYGRISSMTNADGDTLNDMDGLSGGPVFAFKKEPNGSLKYWIVGIQSTWRRDLKTLAFSSFEDFVSALEADIQRVRDEETSATPSPKTKQ